MRLHFFQKIGFVDRIHFLRWIKIHVFVVAQIAIGLVFNNLAFDSKQAIKRVGFAFVDFLDDFFGGRVFPAHGIGNLFLFFCFERDVGFLAGSFECIIKAIEIILLFRADSFLQGFGFQQ